jgi:RHS repeat-associated protein
MHNGDDIEITKNGYIYIYVSNSSNIPMFFDNLFVTQTSDALMEETHYYPFGLTMSGISSKAAGTLENKRKYNGIEFDEDLGLNIYEAFYRHLDTQTGRWWEIDPKIDAGYENITPYNSMFNDPIRYSDFMGDEASDGDGNGCCGGIWKEIKSVGKEMWRSLGDAPATIGRGYTNYVDPIVVSFNENVNPITNAIELVKGKSYASNFTEGKPRANSAMELAMTFFPGLKAEGALIKAETKLTEKAVAKDATRSVEENATKISKDLNGGKARVELRSQNEMKRIDLNGEKHFDKKTNTSYNTPHTVTSTRNAKAPNQPAYNTSEKHVKYSNTTAQELRMVRKYLKNNQ